MGLVHYALHQTTFKFKNQLLNDISRLFIVNMQRLSEVEMHA